MTYIESRKVFHRCSVFFEVKASRVQPQEETQKRLRQAESHIFKGAGHSMHDMAHRATWQRTGIIQETSGGRGQPSP